MTKSKIKVQIKSIWGSILYESEKDTIKEAVSDANLYGANLRDADLRGADLRDADLYGADLRDADLYGADLRDANLYGADLRGANLRGADLRGANLRGADLYGADLRDANLYGADLRGANLRGADLRGANLRGADLYGAKNSDYAAAQTIIVPEGAIIGWKKAYVSGSGAVVIKLRIPEEAKRSNATGRKCRAEYAEVLGIYPIGKKRAMAKSTVAYSQHDNSFNYTTGDTVKPTKLFAEDRFDECAPGIHFFITRVEAENY